MATLGQIDHGCVILAPVSSGYARLQLEIEPGVNPVTGRLTGPHGRRTAFAGWAQLIRAIEQAAGVHLDSPEADDRHEDSNTTRRST